MLTQKRLKEALIYNGDTGIFTNRIRRIMSIEGTVVGSNTNNGYIAIHFDGKRYLAHRLAWLYIYGYFPENNIDHINRNKKDNRISNLREVSQQCNIRNSKLRKTNKSGVTGVCWYKNAGKWLAHIKINNKAVHLGRFDDKKDAVRARWDAEKKYKFPNCCTTSTAFNYLNNNNI